jgi:hypothetical protein
MVKNYELDERRNVTGEMTFILPTINEPDLHKDMNILLMIGVFLVVILGMVMVGIVGMFASCNPKNNYSMKISLAIIISRQARITVFPILTVSSLK